MNVVRKGGKRRNKSIVLSVKLEGLKNVKKSQIQRIFRIIRMQRSVSFSRKKKERAVSHALKQRNRFGKSSANEMASEKLGGRFRGGRCYFL